MKKLLVILFALGLVFAFSAPVMAVDVSFDGSYRIRGWYDSNSALQKESTPSAYYDQRMRVGTTFQVAEGLKVITRFDALDGIWGTTAMRGDNPTAVNNVQFDKAYVQFVTGIGQVRAGFFSDGVWGTDFGDLEIFCGKIDLISKVGDIYLYLNTTKRSEGDMGTVYSDHDNDGYVAAFWYNKDGINPGFLYKYYRVADSAVDNLTTMNIVIPFVKATLGDLYVESEIIWIDGEINNAAGTHLVDLEGLAAYAMAKYNLGSAYVGGLIAYAKGNDPTDATTNGGMADSGGDWDPMLILFNDNCPTSLGWVPGSTTGTAMNNGYIYQVFAGTTIDKLSLRGSFSYATADEVAVGFDGDYGTELDLEASYKIYDNLTYQVGFGYLWAGDYYKGATAAANEIDDTYLLMNKLQVTF